MFGNLMNSFFYGKSGKGDYRQENLPTTRWQLFWEMLGVRLSALFRLNLIYVVIWLPALLVLLRGTMTALSMMADAQPLEDVQAALMGTLLMLAPCIAITGPATAGLSYVTRNWARDEHAFLWTDFKDAMKENWKQSLVASIVTGVTPLLVYVGWIFYGQMAETMPLMRIPQFLLAMAALLWSLAVTYVYPLIVTYEMPLKTIVINALLLAVGRLPQSVAMRVLLTLPVVIAVGASFLFNPITVAMVLLLYYVMIGFGLSRFITASYTNAAFDRFINSRIEGAQVNRGLRQDDTKGKMEE